MHKQDRHAAMWLAENWTEVTRRLDVKVTRCDLGCEPGKASESLSHPRRIREFLMNEPEVKWEEKLPKAKAPDLPEDLQQLTAEKVETIELDQRSAERVAKVLNRAKANDEGSETHRAAFRVSG